MTKKKIRTSVGVAIPCKDDGVGDVIVVEVVENTGKIDAVHPIRLVNNYEEVNQFLDRITKLAKGNLNTLSAAY